MFENYPKWPTFPCPPMQTPDETPLEFDARLWAAYWHRAQVRKYTAEPYINHPCEVANIVRTVPHTDEMIAAAWLHDVVEDCGVTSTDLVAIFPSYVVSLVSQLTDISTPANGNRKARKALDRQHSAMSEVSAKTVKLADLISNSKSIMAHDPNFSRVYLREKRALLELMKDGDPTLWERADKICREAGY